MILQWPSIRVIGSMTIVLVMARSSVVIGRQRPKRAPAVSGVPPLEQVDERLVDEIGRRRAAGQEHVDLDDAVDGPGHRQERRDDLESGSPG